MILNPVTSILHRDTQRKGKFVENFHVPINKHAKELFCDSTHTHTHTHTLKSVEFRGTEFLVVHLQTSIRHN